MVLSEVNDLAFPLEVTERTDGLCWAVAGSVKIKIKPHVHAPILVLFMVLKTTEGLEFCLRKIGLLGDFISTFIFSSVKVKARSEWKAMNTLLIGWCPMQNNREEILCKHRGSLRNRKPKKPRCFSWSVEANDLPGQNRFGQYCLFFDNDFSNYRQLSIREVNKIFPVAQFIQI